RDGRVGDTILAVPERRWPHPLSGNVSSHHAANSVTVVPTPDVGDAHTPGRLTPGMIRPAKSHSRTSVDRHEPTWRKVRDSRTAAEIQMIKQLGGGFQGPDSAGPGANPGATGA